MMKPYQHKHIGKPKTESRDIWQMVYQILKDTKCVFGCGRIATTHTSAGDYVCETCRDEFESFLENGASDVE
jgi:hypothetical protein